MVLLAQYPPEWLPQPMDPIAFPVSIASIVSVLLAAGVALVLAYFGVRIGFRFVRSLLRRLGGAS